MMRFLLISISISFVNPIFGQNMTHSDTLRVNALNGLHLRQQASTKSASKKLLPYGESIVVISGTKGKPISIDGLTGAWVAGISNRDTGYVFDAYLTRLPITPPKPPKNGHLPELLERYALENLGAIDSVYYNNGADGESYHSMTIFNLRDGHQYIRHTLWENFEWELQLQNVEESEGINLVLNWLKLSGKLTADTEKAVKQLSATSSLYVKINEGCCSLSVYKYEKRFIIRLRGGP
ncbi:MAG: hypothetical protein ACKV1O_04620 [Saprospiraceae bacterium]